MTGAAVFAAYAAAAGFGGPAALCRGWSPRMPRTTMSLWLTLAASWIVAVTLAALALAAPSMLTWPASHAQRAGELAGTPGRTVAAGAALLLAAAVVLRACWHVARGLARARRQYRQHSAYLAVAGLPDQALGAVVLDGSSPAAYCIPRGHPRVVITASTLSLLTPGQLQAVLAHERAHLRGRHHLILTIASALGSAFPAIPLLARAGEELAVLAEMAADDAAACRHDRADLAAALVILARAGVRTTALTAGGPAAVARIKRLLATAPRPGLPARTARLAAAAAALAIPAVISCLPLIIAACEAAGRG